MKKIYVVIFGENRNLTAIDEYAKAKEYIETVALALGMSLPKVTGENRANEKHRFENGSVMLLQEVLLWNSLDG